MLTKPETDFIHWYRALDFIEKIAVLRFVHLNDVVLIRILRNRGKLLDCDIHLPMSQRKDQVTLFKG